MCKNHLVLNLPNDEDYLILETDARNEHWSTVFKIIEGEKLCKYCSGSFYKEECNYPTIEKEIIVVCSTGNIVSQVHRAGVASNWQVWVMFTRS